MNLACEKRPKTEGGAQPTTGLRREVWIFKENF